VKLLVCIFDEDNVVLRQAAKSIKTSEFMPYIVFIAAAPVEIQRNMYEYARLKGKMDKIRNVNTYLYYFE
jgi:hypothetical protein